MLKVLVISSYDDNFNAVRPEGELFIGLHHAGVEVEIMTQANTLYGQRFQEQGLKVYDHHPKGKFSSESVRLIRKILLDGQHDILHLFNSKAIVNGLRAAYNLPVKIVTYRGFAGHIHWYDPSSYLTHLNPRVDKIMCVSYSIYDQLSQQITLPKHKLAVVFKRHQNEWYHDIQPADIQAEFKLPSDAFVVVCVANARKFKGIPYLLKATDHLPKEKPIYLLLVGRGMDTREHLKIIEQTDFQDRVLFAGFRKDVLELIAASDAFILPSTGKEGLPKVLIEAMSLGKPCIGTNIRANESILFDRENGIKIPIKDPQAIARSILEYYDQAAFRKQMGENALRFMQNEFTVDKSVEELIQLYQSMVKNG